MYYIFYKKIKKIQLIRPVIILSRFETFKLSQFWSLPINIDSTNKLTIFRRNRIRHQILPTLKFFFNPKMDQAFLRFINDINLDTTYFNKQVKENENFIRLHKFRFKKSKIEKIKVRKFFAYLPKNLQKKIYKKTLKIYLKNITSQEINSILELKIFKNK